MKTNTLRTKTLPSSPNSSIRTRPPTPGVINALRRIGDATLESGPGADIWISASGKVGVGVGVMVGSSVIGNGVGVNVGGVVGLGIGVTVASSGWSIVVAVASSIVGVDVGNGVGGRSVVLGEGGAGMTQAWRLPRSRNIIP